MYITVCVIAYNEEKFINRILGDIVAQDYEHSKMELLLVDSASSDGTKGILEEFAKNHKSTFRKISVLDNPGRTLPCGWNVALSAYEGEAIVKVDAHATIPKDFVSTGVKWLQSGEYVVGGERPCLVEEPGGWKDTLLLAESSMFGSSIAPYRNNPGKNYVKSLFHGCYRREVFDKVGMFNEHLARTEDNEMNYRIREAGYKLLFAPDIKSYQYIRGTLGSMLKQKYANGYWIGLTTGVCPKCLAIYHYVPLVFLLAIIVSLPGTIINGLLFPDFNLVALLAGIMWGAYWLLALVMAVCAIVTAGDKRNITNIALPVLFFLLHISYGAGTLVGLIKMPKWLKNIKGGFRE